MSDKRFILWDPRLAPPFRGGDGQLVPTLGVLGELEEDHTLLGSLNSAALDALEVGQRIEGQFYGSYGILDLYRVR